MQGAKSANNELFKDFCNDAEKEKSKSDGGLYLINVPWLIVKVGGAKMYFLLIGL